MRYLFGDYVLDTQRAELHGAGAPIKLRRKAFQVLAYLLAHRDRVVPKHELLEHLWPDQFVGDAVLKACITALRKALGERGRAPRFVRTLHGQGYRFVAAVEVREHLPADDGAGGAAYRWQRPTPLPTGEKLGRRRERRRPWPIPWTGNTNRSPCCVGLWPRRPPWRRAWGRRRCTT